MLDFTSFFVVYTLDSVSKFRGLKSIGFANLLSQLATNMCPKLQAACAAAVDIDFDRPSDCNRLGDVTGRLRGRSAGASYVSEPLVH